MTDTAPLPPEGSSRRRESWSLRTLVEEVSGRPLGDFQDPSRPTHPYVEFHRRRTAAAVPAEPAVEADPVPDPIDRVYPPLVGTTGRALHGPANEHHAETLASVAGDGEPETPGRRPHAPGPARRPERVYLHYLLLHLDRLNDGALLYLRNAVDEELRQRSEPPPPAH